VPGHFSHVFRTEIPGVAARFTTHPTAADITGRDGLYFDVYFIYDREAFQKYVDWTAQVWYKYSYN